LIEVRNLCKKYGDSYAIKNLNFNVKKGIYGFLGPNGAGKTTTMNIITGCLAATEGSVMINGHDIFEEPVEAKKLIGYLPEQPPLYPEMTPFEYLLFAAEAKGVKGEDIDEQVETVMRETRITAMKNRLIKNLSKGYKQRVGIAQAMLGNPEIIILDEPTVGLDPKQIIEIRELIASLGKNRTVIISSHILSEISAICDYVMIISHGRMIASDTIHNMQLYLVGANATTLTVKADRSREEEIRELIDAIAGVEDVAITAEKDNSEKILTVKVRSTEDTDVREALFFAFAEAKIPIIGMQSTALSLEDIFLTLTDENKYNYEDEAAEEEGPARIFGEDAPELAEEPEEVKEPEPVPEEKPEEKTEEPEEEAPKKKKRRKKDSDDDSYTPMFGN